MSDDEDRPPAATWSNGFTLKKTRDGYSWTISVRPKVDSIESLEEAIDEAAKLDQKVRAMYGTDLAARLR